MNKNFVFKSPRKITEEPVFLVSDENLSGITSLSANGRIFPASQVEGGILAVLSADSGETLNLTAGSENCGGCKVENDAEARKLRLNTDGFSFADYAFDPSFPKPHLGPITDNCGNFFTRCDLMNREHPHQRSVIIAIGSVNGVDCWNEHPAV